MTNLKVVFQASHLTSKGYFASSISPSEEGAFTDKRKVGKPTEKREGTKGSVKPFRPYDCLAVIDPRNRSAEVVPVIIFEK